jgi:hypothetical protein
MNLKNSKFLAALILIGVLAVVFAAFDDITTGNEPSLVGEYWVIGMSVVVLGGVLVWLMQTGEKPKATVKTKKTSKKKK